MTEEEDETAARHTAVALQYEHGEDAAPRVTAKGKGAVADAIVETAQRHGVAVESNALLAEALSRVELDQQIPRELYRAVAEVIGFVLRLSAPTPVPRK
ncbi:MAG TPA: EscU/YscU/HrcU family type III secretion system export apparatus switch protein [Hyphomicrobiales bacterium]|jgi:flagellar biosynthesis protein